MLVCDKVNLFDKKIRQILRYVVFVMYSSITFDFTVLYNVLIYLCFQLILHVSLRISKMLTTSNQLALSVARHLRQT